MTGGRSVPCRSFTKAHAVSELTFSVSQMSLPNLGAISAPQGFAPKGLATGVFAAVQGVISRVRWEVRGT